MLIILNGESHEVRQDCTVADLLAALNLTHGKRLAVEVNQEIVPRSQFESQRLNSGDRVEIVHAIGGG
jgi:thiamine biosynthesis protein ThiS